MVCLTIRLVYRYGGLSVGGQLPILDLDPTEIQNTLKQVGRMMNITGVHVQEIAFKTDLILSLTKPNYYRVL